MECLFFFVDEKFSSETECVVGECCCDEEIIKKTEESTKKKNFFSNFFFLTSFHSCHFILRERFIAAPQIEGEHFY